MTTPRLGAPELATSQANKEETVNEQIRYIEAAATMFTFKSRTTTAQPGSPADGDCYLLPASPTGAQWSGHGGDIALRINTSWVFIDPIEGFTGWVEDENTLLVFYGISWLTFAATKVNTYSGTSVTFAFIDAFNVAEFTSGSSVTATIPPNSDASFPVGTVIEIHQAGSGVVTITPGSGVTLQSRGSVYATAGLYAMAAIRKVATNTWRLTGDIA